MPKSNCKPNAFYFFMLDWKKQEENKGHLFPNGLKDVQSDWRCNNMWKNLSKEDKARYKEKEKTYKIQTYKDKKTSFGESVCQLQQTKRAEMEFYESTKQYISSLIYEAKKSKTIQKLKFFVIHINYFYARILDNNEVDYTPAELAIAEFCLEEGITRIYHKIIKSKIELGYAYEASQHSKNTHQIPKDTKFGEENYSLIYKEICDFLHSDKLNGKLPILFTRYEVDSIKYPVINVLRKLSNFNKITNEHFTTYSFEELFAHLYNIISEENADAIKFDAIIASMTLKNDPFDYKGSIQCEFHHQALGGGNYCSKSLVQRWIFALFSYTSYLLGIDLKPGYHKPVENTNEKQLFELHNMFSKLCFDTSSLESQTTAKKSTKQEEKYASKRMHQERHKLELMAKPIIFIDHSKINETCKNRSHVSEIKELEYLPFLKQTVINSYEEDFPSLGRGRNSEKNYSQKSKSIAGLPGTHAIHSYKDDYPSLGRGRRKNSSS